MRSSFLWLAAVLVLTPAQGADFLPLENHNEWVYSDATTGQSFRIRVGLPTFVNQRVYHSLRGYTDSPLLVRYDDLGQLVFFDEERYREEVLVSFAPFERGWWQADQRGRDTEGQTLEKRSVHDGPVGPIRESLQIRYRCFACADVGVQSEEFAENLGMLRRVVTTIAGPRIFNLVYARVGRMVLEGSPGGRFSVSVEPLPNSSQLRATLRLTTSSLLPLEFASSQFFDAVLRDAAGQVVWRWSDGQAFAPVLVSKVFHGEWTTTFEFPKPNTGGHTLQAWMSTLGDVAYFAASTPVSP